MLELVKQLDCEKQVVLGYRKAPFLLEEFQQYAKVSVATEDGSFGVTGTVIDKAKWLKSGRDLCLRADSHAARGKSVCRRKPDRMFCFIRRTNGLWDWRMFGMRLQIKRS